MSEPGDDDDTRVTLAEFCREAKMQHATAMYRLREAPERMPASTKTGRHRVFTRRAIREWEAANAQKAGQHPHTRNNADHREAIRTGALLSAYQASKIAGRSAGAMRRAGLPMRKVGLKWFIEPEVLRIFLETQATPSCV